MTKSLQEVRDTVAQNLSEALADKGLTQKDLVDKFQISKAAASNWCRGVKKPKTETILALAEWLEVPVSYLLGTEVFENWPAVRNNLSSFLRAVRDAWGEELFQDTAVLLYAIDPKRPEKAALSDLTYFIYHCFSSITPTDTGWTFTDKLKTPAPVTEDKRSEIQIIFDQLSPANQSKLIELSRLYLASQHKTEESE